MRVETISRRISSAIEVRWTPALAARVERRIEHGLARRHRRRRATLLALALLGFVGTAYAFTRPWASHARRAPSVTAGPIRLASPPATADLPPVVPEEAPVAAGLPALPGQERPRSHRAAAGRHRVPVETVEALLAAADAARLAGRPADAVAPLTAIFNRHASDPRAAIAAYELGRVLTFDLHDRERAAAAFARAHDLDPTGPLAADAAAHAAEARRAAADGGTE